MMTLAALARFDGTITRLGIVLSPDGSPQEVEGVLNPASATARDGTLLLYPRAVASRHVSRVGMVPRERETVAKRSYERVGFALEPQAPYELRRDRRWPRAASPRVTFLPATRSLRHGLHQLRPARPAYCDCALEGCLHLGATRNMLHFRPRFTIG